MIVNIPFRALPDDKQQKQCKLTSQKYINFFYNLKFLHIQCCKYILSFIFTGMHMIQ